MAAACQGARETGGRTIGILPGTDLTAANRWVDVPIATRLGNTRHVLVVRNGEGVIAIDGRHGTLSEVAHALDLGRPVVGFRTQDVDEVTAVDSPEDALSALESRLSS